jgi:hypothetical protein
MDNMLILYNNDHMIKSTKKMLSSKFYMKELGVAIVILGINIYKTSNGLILSKSYYVKKSFEKFSKSDNSTIKISINISVHLSKNRGKGINQLKYSWITRNLIYVMNYTGIDIAYSVNKRSRYTSNLSLNHYKVIKMILKYLRYILDYRLYYTGYLVMLE